MRALPLCLLLVGCASSNYDKPYQPKQTYLRPQERIEAVCNGNPSGCSFFFRGSRVCQVYAREDAPNLQQILRHENLHCNGYK